MKRNLFLIVFPFFFNLYIHKLILQDYQIRGLFNLLSKLTLAS